MKKLQIFFIGILMLLLALLTAVISLYAVNPDFAAFLKDKLNKAPEVVSADVDSTESAPVNNPDESAAAVQNDMEESVEDADTDGVDAAVPMDYIPPAEADIKVPEGLSDKTGYEKITVQEKTVSDEEADRIEEELSTGPTGDEFSFDPEFYPYYAMLDDRGKALYRQIYANINELNPSFRSIDRLMTGRRIDSAFEAVFNDHPELFWVDTEYRTIYRKNGDFIELDLFYNDTAENIEASRSEFLSAADRIISEAGGSDYEKEKYVHNRLSELFEYKRNPLDQSAYSGLVMNSTVCAGYARSFSYILTRMGIPCYLCTGYAGEPHGWNIIRLDGEYYNVDVTWDDTGTDEPYTYDWFNKTDRDFGSTHIRKSLSVYLPPCNGTKYGNLEEVKEEPAEPENGSSLEEYGFSEKDVIRDMNLYYDELYESIVRLGKGHHTLSMVIGEEIMDECKTAYDNSEIKNRVLEKVLKEIGGTTANVSCNATKLQGGYYVISHDITVY
ncbi:MAG: hypothetical protein K5668_07120 [Lachnospiraceae bacterium]|nr:hypothetical protein [Lachnospiraceae bacterium]